MTVYYEQLHSEQEASSSLPPSLIIFCPRVKIAHKAVLVGGVAAGAPAAMGFAAD